MMHHRARVPVDVFAAIDRCDLHAVKDAVVPGEANLRDARHDATLLHWAANHGSVSTVHHLLACGADVRSRDGKHFALPLHWAAAKGHVVVVRLLIMNESDVNGKDTNNRTPLHWAAGNGQLGVIRELLTWRASVDSVDTWGRMPLHWAIFRGHIGSVAELIYRGSPVDHKDAKGNAPGSAFHESVPQPARKAIQDNVNLTRKTLELERVMEQRERQQQVVAFLVKELDQTKVAMTTKSRELEDACVKRDRALKQKLAKEEQRLCVVCLESERAVVLLPCRHLCLCSGCSQRQGLSQCPLCRSHVADKLTVYLS